MFLDICGVALSYFNSIREQNSNSRQDFNNANYVTKVDHLCSERHTFNFLLKKVDFRDFFTFSLDF